METMGRNAIEDAFKTPKFSQLSQAAEIEDIAGFSKDAAICAFDTTISEATGRVFTTVRSFCQGPNRR